MRNTKSAFLKRAILKGLHALGYDLLRLPRVWDGQAYGPVLPTATYCPWNTDRDFLQTYEEVRHFTLVDLYKCYELWSLVGQVAKLSGSLIEVGAWRGGSGALMARKARLCGIAAPVYLCDTFTGVVKAGPNDPVYVGGEHADTSRRVVEQLIGERMGLDNARILEGMFPEQTGHLAGDDRFRLCHIDVDTYESARGVVRWIDERMVIGGVFVYDDYGYPNTSGITKFVEEESQRSDRLVIHNLNGHAIVVRIA